MAQHGFRPAVFVAALAAFAALSSAAFAQQELVVRDGKAEYAENCAVCHGDTGKGNGRLAEIPGVVPSLREPITGCAFAPRCPHVRDICRAEVPELVGLDGGLSRCARAAELRGQLRSGAAEHGPGEHGPGASQHRVPRQRTDGDTDG